MTFEEAKTIAINIEKLTDLLDFLERLEEKFSDWEICYLKHRAYESIIAKGTK